MMERVRNSRYDPHNRLVARSWKRTRAGRGRYFTCSNEECARSIVNVSQFFLPGDGGWKRVELERGMPAHNDGRCLKCGGRLMRAGFIDKRARLRRLACENQGCRQRHTFDEKRGTLAPARAPGFQRKHDPPQCAEHSVAMRKARSWRRQEDGLRVYRWRCSRSRCPYVLYLDADGDAVERRKPEAHLHALMCQMPGCKERRADNVDGRRRYCLDHSKLTDVQRHRLKRRLLAAITEEFGQRYSSKAAVDAGAPARAGILTEWARWLRARAAAASLSAAELARVTGHGSIRNWFGGISMPRSKEDFARVGQVLGCSLDDFLSDFLADGLRYTATRFATSASQETVAGRPISAS